MNNIDNKLNDLKNSKTLESFFYNLQTLNSEIDSSYPNIQCKTGCNRCCKFYGSPEIFDFEWNIIKKHIEDSFTNSELKRIEKKLNDGFSNYKNKQINNNINPESFFECPFIYKNKCSIYEKRPFICRVFGYSKNKDKLLSCVEEIEKFDNISQLPELNDLKDILLKIVSKEEKINTIIFFLNKYFNNKKEE
jgi:Fe-S-cluster containining protein